MHHKFFDNILNLKIDLKSDVAVCVSGGVDSMVLLYCVQKKFLGKIYAITIDHNLREESGEEVIIVRANIREINKNINHKIIK